MTSIPGGASDRQLLEWAAKAYWGEEIDDVVSVEWGEQDQAILYTHADNQDHNGLDCTYRWNSLTDGDDALNLAAKLGFSIHVHDTSIGVSQYRRGGYLGGWLDRGLDDAADYRLAITRAAAEIGKAME